MCIRDRRKARFKFTANERGSTFACSLNRSDYTLCESPHRVKADKGRNKFQVLAIDEDGSVEPKPATYKWTVKKGKGKGKRGARSRSGAAAPSQTQPLAPPVMLIP